MKTSRWLLLLCLLVPSNSDAQTKKIAIAVTHTGNDSAGRGFAFALREAIRASQAFVLVDNDPNQIRIVVRIVSQDTDRPERGVRSAIAAAIVYDSSTTPASGTLLTLFINVCGRDVLEACAKQVLPILDEEIEKLRIDWPSLWKTL